MLHTDVGEVASSYGQAKITIYEHVLLTPGFIQAINTAAEDYSFSFATIHSAFRVGSIETLMHFAVCFDR
jgi:hypothetical protein